LPEYGSSNREALAATCCEVRIVRFTLEPARGNLTPAQGFFPIQSHATASCVLQSGIDLPYLAIKAKSATRSTWSSTSNAGRVADAAIRDLLKAALCHLPDRII